MNQWEVEWSKAHFAILALNAIWGVPRSGLVFKKISKNELTLDKLLPWSEDMNKDYAYGHDVPPTKENLRKYQQMEFEGLARRFKAAGIKLTDPKQLLKD